jgi:hypothetical protein
MTNQQTIVDQLKRDLEAGKIHFQEHSFRDGYHMLYVAVPGQRWEIEVSPDGAIEFEVFRSNGDILDWKQLQMAIIEFTDS